MSAVTDSGEALTRLAPVSYFLHLLKGEPEAVGEGLLVHPKEQPAHTDASTDMNVDRCGTLVPRQNLGATGRGRAPAPILSRPSPRY